MRKFIVNTDQIFGLNNAIYQRGREISESQLAPNHADILLKRNKLIPVVERFIEDGEKIRLAIVTSAWQRLDVLKMFAKGIKHLMDTCKDFEITLIVSASIQDDKELTGKTFERAFSIIPKGQLVTIEIPNEPLAAKVNATTYACKKRDFHYVLCVGSDDVISPDLLNEYGVHMRKGIDFIGVTDCYFYDTVSKRALYWAGYRETYRAGFTCGAFRAISTNLLSKWDFMPWENKDSLNLDHSMQIKLQETQHSKHIFSLKEKGIFALDIKSSTNMTPFNLWDNSVFIDSEILKKHFAYVWN